MKEMGRGRGEGGGVRSCITAKRHRLDPVGEELRFEVRIREGVEALLPAHDHVAF